MCQIFCCSIIQGVSFNYHQRNVRSRSRIPRSRSRLSWQSLGLGLVSKFEPGLGLGCYRLDYVTERIHLQLSTHCIMVQSGDLFRQETHPLTFILQNYDADILRTNELHWQQPWNCFFVFILEACKILNNSQPFFKENVRYPVWIFRDPISLILGTRFSLILGTRWQLSLILGTRFEILRTRIGRLKRLKKNLITHKVSILHLFFHCYVSFWGCHQAFKETNL